MPRPSSGVFSYFLEILKPSNRDLKTTHVPFGVVACTFTLFSNKRSRNSCMHLVVFHFINNIHHFFLGGGRGRRNERKQEEGMVNFANFKFEVILRRKQISPRLKIFVEGCSFTLSIFLSSSQMMKYKKLTLRTGC